MIRYLKLVLFWVLWIPSFLLEVLIVPIALLFADRETDRLPPLFWIWDTKHGINGDLDWIADCNADVYMAPDPVAACRHLHHWKSGDERHYSNRVKWLLRHNPNSNLRNLLAKKGK